MYDLLIKNGTVVDGTGAPRFQADVAVKDGKIARIAPEIAEEAETVIDARGLVVAPGFIDTHTHSDGTVFSPETTGYNHLEDGATTELAGQCGSMAAPYYGEFDPSHGISKEEYERICESYTSYFAYVDSIPHGANLAFFAGQGPIRGKVMGFGDGTPNEEQLEQMRSLMREAMECGCLGFSTGLVYTPSVFAGTHELVEIARVAHEYGGVYTTHIRGEGNQLKESIEEALVIGRESGIPVNISHIKVIGRQNEGNSRDIIRTVLSEEGTFAVVPKDGNGDPIGAIGVFPTEIPEGRGEPEIGYWIARPYWGQGLIPEVVDAMLRRQFQEMGAERVWCAHFPGNERSRRVQEKCGFRHVCDTPPSPWPDGTERPGVCQAITRQEWEVRHG